MNHYNVIGILAIASSAFAFAWWSQWQLARVRRETLQCIAKVYCDKMNECTVKIADECKKDQPNTELINYTMGFRDACRAAWQSILSAASDS